MSEHAQAYACLVQTEAQAAARELQTRWAWFSVCVAGGVVAAILAGVSAMLWVVASESEPALVGHWVFWIAPVVPAVLSALAGWKFARCAVSVDFPLTREQLALDARWLDNGKESLS
ncbi:hypothetical protein NBRC116584_04040 [Hydrogenophaga sp. 5NK40-0174]